MPPQNPVDDTIVDVSTLGVKLAYPMLQLVYALLATARSSLRPTRAPPNLASVSPSMEGKSSLSRWSAGSIIVTHDAQPEAESRSYTASSGGVIFAHRADAALDSQIPRRRQRM